MCAWAIVEAAHPDWWLRIISPDELGHARELAATKLKPQRVSIEGPVAGEAKAAACREAVAYLKNRQSAMRRIIVAVLRTKSLED